MNTRRDLLLAAIGLIALPGPAAAQGLLDQGRNLLNQGGVSIPGTGGSRGAGLSVDQIVQGLKDALAKGSNATVSSAIPPCASRCPTRCARCSRPCARWALPAWPTIWRRA
jgi:hypothetical protein